MLNPNMRPESPQCGGKINRGVSLSQVLFNQAKHLEMMELQEKFAKRPELVLNR